MHACAQVWAVLGLHNADANALRESYREARTQARRGRGAQTNGAEAAGMKGFGGSLALGRGTGRLGPAPAGARAVAGVGGVLWCSACATALLVVLLLLLLVVVVLLAINQQGWAARARKPRSKPRVRTSALSIQGLTRARRRLRAAAGFPGAARPPPLPPRAAHQRGVTWVLTGRRGWLQTGGRGGVGGGARRGPGWPRTPARGPAAALAP